MCPLPLPASTTFVISIVSVKLYFIVATKVERQPNEEQYNTYPIAFIGYANLYKTTNITILNFINLTY